MMRLILFCLILVTYPNIVEATPTPNIIYILADDMGPGDVSAYNPEGRIPTPNIDRIAVEGITFTDAHSNSSVCTPTRYGILTGRYAWRTELKSRVLNGHSPPLIKKDRLTVGEFLQDQGYRTACIGKWHLGMDWAYQEGSADKKDSDVDLQADIQNGPVDRGFDYYFGISASLNMSPHAYIRNKRIVGTLEYLKGKQGATDRGFTQPSNGGWAAKEYVQQNVLKDLAGEACKWIEEQKENPFFVYIPLPSPHSPIVPSEKFQGKGVNTYADFCLETDWLVGEVLRALDDNQLTEDTLIIFTADNGSAKFVDWDFMHEIGHYPSLHYRGMKGTLWEGGHRVPFVLRWPGKAEAGSKCEQAICTTDLLATCAELFGVSLADNQGEDSYSFLPAIMGKPIPNLSGRVITHHSDAGVFAIRQGNWKLMLDARGGSQRWNPKDERFDKNNEVLLFDIVRDPSERTNLADQSPEIVENLKRELAHIIKTGRSTKGASQLSDYNEEGVEWPQIESVRKYLD
ncbi:MAG: arylsulfatase [Verrucomicrobiota bacterium]